MSAVDTSVVVPALLSWHENHEACRTVMEGTSIPAHALIESFSVLTRLPQPHRLAGVDAERLLSGWFPPARILIPPDEVSRGMVRVLAGAGVEGGASYDGLIGLTAQAHAQRLLTRDGRALSTYEALDVEAEFLGT